MITQQTNVLPQIRLPKYDFFMTRNFMEKADEFIGGGIREASTALSNILVNREELRLTKKGETFKINIADIFEIKGTKISEKEMQFTSIKKNFLN